MATIPESFSVIQELVGRSWDSTYIAPVNKPLALIGELVDGGTISLRTDGTYNFGEKPLNQKTLFVWRADKGASPVNWGEASSWNGTSFSGDLSSEVTGMGMTVAMRQKVTTVNQESTPAFLGRIDFDSDYGYLYKRRYNDYEMPQSATYMLPYESLEGTLPEVGTRLVASNGANGLVVGNFRRDGHDWVQFHPTDAASSVNKPSVDMGLIIFPQNEVISWDTGSFTSLGTTSNQKECNDKNNRFWAATTGNNTYTQTGQPGLAAAAVTTENTGTTRYTSFDRHSFVSKEWYDEEIIYKGSSALGEADGVFDYYRDGVLGQSLTDLVTRNSERPEKYSQVRLDQLTRGTSFGEYYRYIDYVYFDTSYCRVLLTTTPDLHLGDAVNLEKHKTIPLPVQSWDEDSIELVFQGTLPDWTHLVVVGVDNVVIATGSREDLENA